VTIHSGSLARTLVEKKLLQPNRFPIVCNALRSKRFSRENHLTLQEVQTPAASGKSFTVSFVFRLDPTEATGASGARFDVSAFADLRGLLKRT
jgi:hypothetical protein